MRKDGVLVLLLVFSILIMLLPSMTVALRSQSKTTDGFSAETTPPDTIIWETIGSPDNLDPHVNYEAFGAWVLFNVYETLFTYPFNSSDTTPSIPLLAEDLVISEDGLGYTFSLRQGVTFHDGTPFNASSVKYNFERVMKIFDPYGPAWMFAEAISGGQAVEDAVYGYGNGSPEHAAAYDNWKANSGAIIVLDTYTVQLKLAHRWAPFIAAITCEVGAMMSPTWVEAHGGVQYGQHNTYVDEHTCGSGPYVVSNWTRDSTIKLDINPLYWRTASARAEFPHAGEVNHVLILTNDDTEARILNVSSGRTDACYWPVTHSVGVWNGLNGSSGDGTRKSSNPNLKLWCQEPTYSVSFIGFNLNPYVFSSVGTVQNPFVVKALRESLSYALNYTSFIGQAVNGLGMPGQGPIPKGMFGHNDSLFMYEQDMDMAVQKWNAAMAEGLNGILANMSYRIDLRYRGAGENAARPCMTIKNAIADILSDADTIQPSQPLVVEVIAVQDMYLPFDWEKLFMLYPTGWMPDYADPDDYVRPYVMSTGYYATRIGLAVSEGWNSTLVDGWISAATEELNPASRIALYGLVQDAIVNQCAYFWTYQAENFHVESTSMNGYVFNPMHEPYFYYYWKSTGTVTNDGFWNPVSAGVTIASIAVIIIVGTAVIRSRRLAG